MLNSYLQLELRRQDIWDAEHQKTMANFKSVAYVHKHKHRYKSRAPKIYVFCRDILSILR